MQNRKTGNKSKKRYKESVQNGSISATKLRGGYYTPADVAEWVCNWAIRSSTETILEPSIGDGAFLVKAVERLAALGAKGSSVARQIYGSEINSVELNRAISRCPNLKLQNLRSMDFFDYIANVEGGFDTVIGNPPFIRYQNFPEPSRTRAMGMMDELSLKPNKLTNIWAAFVAIAISKVNPGGRLAMVIPAELLQVSYAAQLRLFLIESFKSVRIFACNEMIFPDAEQEVVILLADEKIPRSSTNGCLITLQDFATKTDLIRKSPGAQSRLNLLKRVDHNTEKWLKYFLDSKEIELMRALRANPGIAPLNKHCDVEVGVVTGNNDFFVLTQEQIRANKLDPFITPIISRASQLLGAVVRPQELADFCANGDRVNLFSSSEFKESIQHRNPLVQEYILRGETEEVHKGYKCSIRDPWYKVPSVWIPDAFLFRQIYDFPHAVLNKTKATSTDTIHRIRCRKSPSLVVSNAYSYLTAASAEIEGRSYGGGVLELEPSEAERLLISTTLVDCLPLAEIDRLVRTDKLNVVLEEQTKLILKKHLGLSQQECAMLKAIWQKMRDRRSSRKKTAKNAAA